MSRNLLKSFKIKDKSKLTAKQTIIYLGVYFIFGILLGVIAKYSDTVPSNSESGMFYSIISDITTSIGIWIALATLISVWSRSAIYAALKVLAFFVGMLLGYYIYSQVLFGFFPSYYFLRWGAIALVSPICAYIVWFSRGEGWGSAFCAALPIGLLLTQGYSFFYVFSMVLGLDLFAALLLLVILTKSKAQYLKVIPMVILIVIILRNSYLLSYLFGGL
jgi:hypothetical protein